MFVTDFARALPIPSELEFMAVSSYGSATSSSGVVRILKDLDRDITGRRVVIVEDIIDSGLTLSWLLKNLATRGPAAIDVVALLRKPEAVKVEVDVRYVGLRHPDRLRRRVRPRLRRALPGPAVRRAARRAHVPLTATDAGEPRTAGRERPAGRGALSCRRLGHRRSDTPAVGVGACAVV